MLLEGLHIPLTTPFHPDGRLALHKLASNVERYSKTPAAGLIALGPSGEPSLLSDGETREVLRTAAQSAAPEKVLIAGIFRDSVYSTLALAHFAAEQQYDAVLIESPNLRVLNVSWSFENLLGMEEEVLRATLKDRAQERAHKQMAFFRTVADRSPLPLVLLRSPGSQTLELASHPNILGLIDRVGNVSDTRLLLKSIASVRREVAVTPTFAAVTTRMKIASQSSATSALVSAHSLATSATAIAAPSAPEHALRIRTRSAGFQILDSNPASLLEALNAGAAGIASAFAAAAPQACYEVFAAWKDSDPALAEEKQSRLIAAAKIAEASPAALKYACDLNGYFGGLPRPPHLALTVRQREALELQMKDLRN